MTAANAPPVPPVADEAAFRDLFAATYDDLLCFVERRTHALSAEDVATRVDLARAWRRLRRYLGAAPSAPAFSAAPAIPRTAAVMNPGDST